MLAACLHVVRCLLLSVSRNYSNLGKGIQVAAEAFETAQRSAADARLTRACLPACLTGRQGCA